MTDGDFNDNLIVMYARPYTDWREVSSGEGDSNSGNRVKELTRDSLGSCAFLEI